jgi:hypothetical protein
MGEARRSRVSRRVVAAVALTVALLAVGTVPTASAAPAPCTADPIGSVTRLYLAYFLRAPDPTGLAFWLDRCNRGVSSLIDISDAFAGSPEFKLRYGALSNPDFVTLVYRNVLNRAPDAAGLNASVDFLGRGARRGEVMLGFSESPEFKAKQGSTQPATPTTTTPPTASPTTTTPAPPPTQIANVGFSYQFTDNSSVGVASYLDVPGTAFFRPAQGNKFVAIQAHICAGDTRKPYNELGFTVGARDNTRYRPYFSITEPSLDFGDLAPRDCVTGYVTFEVPEVAQINSIFWQYPSWPSLTWARCTIVFC